MAYQKLQVGLALEIVPFDYDIPNPAGPIFESTSTVGTQSNVTTLTLIDANADFIKEGIKPGMVIKGGGANFTFAVVSSVDSATQLTATIENGYVWTEEYGYTIYAETTDGCVLYVGGTLAPNTTGFKIPIITASGSRVTLEGVLPGSFIPVQVRRVSARTPISGEELKIVAFW